MSSFVTGFQGSDSGHRPYFSPRFRGSKTSNATKFYKKKAGDTLEPAEFEDYLSHVDMIKDNYEFDIEDILSPRYAEFGFVRAYKARLRRKGLDPKQLYCVNRHNIKNTRPQYTTPLPKLKQTFLVQQPGYKTKDQLPNFESTEREILQYNVKSFKQKENSEIYPEKRSSKTKRQSINRLDVRLKELEDDSSVPGFITRAKNSGRPLGNVTSTEYLMDLLQDVTAVDPQRRSSIFYRTELV